MSLFSEYRDSKKIVNRSWPVIFFVEKKSDFQYLSHLFNLLKDEGIEICYITSDKSDPLLNKNSSQVTAFYFKYLLGFVFNKLRGGLLIMTMPDLNQFLFKKSPDVSEYVYVFHALVSTQQQYRQGAFDHYDTILCAGPHHEKEIRLREQKKNLSPKTLLQYGYPLLNDWNRDNNKRRDAQITLAPSWYAGCIFETCFYELIRELKKTGYKIVIRFHPEFIKRRQKKYQEIISFIKPFENIYEDKEPGVRESLANTDILITDRSGIAFEYAIATGRPIIFIDTTPKKFNEEAETPGDEPVEDSFRSKMGIRVKPGQLNTLGKVIEQIENGEKLSTRFSKEELIFDFNENLPAIRKYLLERIVSFTSRK